MSAREKSDLPKVAEKRANKVASAAAELAERRGGAKENAELPSTVRTQSRAAVSQAQSRIRSLECAGCARVRDRQAAHQLGARLRRPILFRQGQPIFAGAVPRKSRWPSGCRQVA